MQHEFGTEFLPLYIAVIVLFILSRIGVKKTPVYKPPSTETRVMHSGFRRGKKKNKKKW